MDALLKDRQKGIQKSTLLMSEAWRVLQTNGQYLQISDEDPDLRMDLLDQLWNKSKPEEIINLDNLNSNGDETTDCSKTEADLGSWKFKVITSDWEREYFVYWRVK